MKTVRILGTIALTGAILTLGPVGSATAAETDTTFTLTGGTLTFTAAEEAALTNAASGTTEITGGLGNVVVTDLRGSIAGWSVTASSTAFTAPGGSSSTAVSYNSSAGTKTGTVTLTTEGPTTLTTTEAPVAAGTLASGNNTATFTPTLAVTLPASALADNYSGTVTTSVA